MWSLRRSLEDNQDSYLVQSFVGETRVLGVVVNNTDTPMADNDEMEVEGEESEEEVGGTLEEVVLPWLEPTTSTLAVSNVVGDNFLQVTEAQVRLVNSVGDLLASVQPESPITIAAVNEAGQVVVALRGGKVVYMSVAETSLAELGSKQMEREVSCLNIHPFADSADIKKAGSCLLYTSPSPRD